ncbi:Tetratricopeptide repeat protein 29 [Cyphomyrmex costatus]|uniref:Tetratricopeptide repeat protein 29 n=1 Tax=Cyphomyrmex costatus TaxID=456900 RepID=A0A195CE82_9HYME|nr:Tetratricopeptide repeat protein 29 [Cyphomyrmex costatus]
MKGRLENVQRRDLETLMRQVRKSIPEGLSKVSPKITEATTIKTLAGARSGEMGKVKDVLKAMLPILTPSEVRRFHLLPHEAIIDELEEGDYKESIGYLKELFELDEEIRRKAGPGTRIWEKPRLKKNKNAMSHLRGGLIAVEQAKNAGDNISAVAEFLNMALSFQAMTWEWWWVAERLYRSALENAELVEDDRQQTRIFVRYLYGRFLFEQIQDTTGSLYHLNIAREASQKKPWNASKITGRKEETIFRECNVLLYKVLLMHAQQVGYDQPDVAVKAYTEALARATDSGHYEYTANALYELGMSQLRSGDVKLAFQNFSKFMAMTKRISDPEGICNAHMAMALTYNNSHLQELNDDINTEKHLRLFMTSAIESGLTRRVAQAHYCTGEHFLNKRMLDIATLHLEKSFEMYNKLGLCNDADKARALAGVSKG